LAIITMQMMAAMSWVQRSRLIECVVCAALLGIVLSLVSLVRSGRFVFVFGRRAPFGFLLPITRAQNGEIAVSDAGSVWLGSERCGADKRFIDDRVGLWIHLPAPSRCSTAMINRIQARPAHAVNICDSGARGQH
jgi:hypothetical protein